MKNLFTFLLISLLATTAYSQTPVDTADLREKINSWVVPNSNRQITASKVNQLLNGVASLMKAYAVDSAYRVNDTLFLTRRGGFTTIKVTLNPDQNLATAPLTANGNYTHNWGHKQLFVDSTGDLRFAMWKEPDQNLTPRKISNVLTFDNRWTFYSVHLGSTLTNVAGSDSVSHGFRATSAGAEAYQINATGDVSLVGASHQEAHMDVHNNSKSSGIFVSPGHILAYANDSILVKGIEVGATADTVVTLARTTDNYFKLKRTPSAALFAAQNGITKNGNIFELGGALTKKTDITSPDTSKYITITGQAGFNNRGVIQVTNNYNNIGGSSSAAVYAMHNFGGTGVWAQSLSGSGVQAVSNTGVGISGTSQSGTGVVATIFGDTIGRPLFVDQRYSPTNSYNRVYDAIQINRSQITFPGAGHGMGSRIVFTMPEYNYLADPTGRYARCTELEWKALDYNGPDQTSEFNVNVMGDSVMNKILSLNGRGFATWHKYGTGTPYETVDTSFASLVVDANGKMWKRHGGGGGGATPSLEDVLGVNADLTTPWTTGFSGTSKWTFNGSPSSLSAVIEANSTSGTGFGLKGTSVSGYGVYGSGGGGGVYGTSGSAPGGEFATFNNANLNAPIWSLNTGRTVDVNNVISGLDLSRSSVGGTPGNGSGLNIRWYLMNNDGTGASVRNTIDAVTTTATPASYASDFVFKTTTGGALGSALTLKGNKQAIWHGYGINTFAGTPAYALGVDASGNQVEFAVPSGSSYTFTNGLTESGGIVKFGATLTQNTTVNTGGFSTSWIGANESQTLFTVSNTGTSGANAISGSATGTASIGVSGTSTSYIGVFGNSTTNTGIQGQSSSGVGVIGVSSTGAALRGQNNPASTNAIENVVTILRTTSAGAGANGLGAAIQYELETATSGTSQIAGSTAFKWTDATNATRTSQFEVYGVNSGTLAQRFTVKGSGQIQHNNYGVGTFTGTPASYPAYDASGNIIERLYGFRQTANVSVVANDNETTLVGTGVGSLVIPANTMVAGKSYRLTVRGKYGTDASNPAQMNWRTKLGSTTICATGNAGLGTNKVDKNYEIHVEWTCRTTGATGTVMAQGMFFTEDGPGANGIDNAFATATINTTIANTLDFTVDMTDGSAGNSCYTYILIFEEI